MLINYRHSIEMTYGEFLRIRNYRSNNDSHLRISTPLKAVITSI